MGVRKRIHLEVENENFVDGEYDNLRAGICGTGQSRYRNTIWSDTAQKYVIGPNSAVNVTILVKDKSKVTCKACLRIIKTEKRKVFHALYNAINYRILTKDEYLAYWDEVMVTQVMDG